MQNVKTTPETTSSYLSKEDLKTLLISKQDKIKKLVSEVKHCKAITLSTTLKGEYMISTARKRLSPSDQSNIEHWHYSFSAYYSSLILTERLAREVMAVGIRIY